MIMDCRTFGVWIDRLVAYYLNAQPRKQNDPPLNAKSSEITEYKSYMMVNSLSVSEIHKHQRIICCQV
jgi:hypothetical protein